MIQVEPEAAWQQFIENQFTKRKVLGGSAGLVDEKDRRWIRTSAMDTDIAVKKALKEE